MWISRAFFLLKNDCFCSLFQLQIILGVNEDMKKRSLFYGLAMLVAVSTVVSGAAAQNRTSSSRRGLITTAACPFGCKDLKLSPDQCRETRAGDLCQVEDFTQPAGHQSMARVAKSESISRSVEQSKDGTRGRGLVTSSSCPYSCKTAKVAAEQCREWTDGEKCYVEDLGQPAGHRSRVKAPF